MTPLTAHLLFYIGLLLLLTAEEAGVFLLPGDISIVAAGVYASQGGPFIFVSWLVASIGMVAGACIMFFTVRRSHRTTRALPQRVRGMVLRHGSLGVGLARLVPGLRNATVFAAGAASLSPYRFLAGLVPAAIAWSGFLLVVGWFGGDTILATLGNIEGQQWVRILSVGLVVCAAAFWLSRMWITRRPSPRKVPITIEPQEKAG